MSDVQQGPGWWLASDGRWYPPESRPQPLPPPPVASPPGGAGPTPVYQPYGAPAAPTQPPYGQQMPGAAAYGQPFNAGQPAYGAVQRRSVSSGLSGTIQGFFWALCAFSILAAVVGLVSLLAFNTYWDTPINSRAEEQAYDDWIAIDDGFSTLAGFAVICGLVLFVLLIIWSNSAHKTTQQLWFGDRKWSSGWTVGAWFIPLANAILPKLVLNEIERLALEQRVGGQAAATWRTRSLVAVGNLWWFGLVAGMVLTQIGGGIGNDVESSSGDIRASYALTALGLSVVGVSAIFGALYIRRLGRRLSPAGMQLEP